MKVLVCFFFKYKLGIIIAIQRYLDSVLQGLAAFKEDSKLAISLAQSNKLLNPKKLPAFYALDGFASLEKALRMDLRGSLGSDEAVNSSSRSHSYRVSVRAVLSVICYEDTSSCLSDISAKPFSPDPVRKSLSYHVGVALHLPPHCCRIGRFRHLL